MGLACQSLKMRCIVLQYTDLHFTVLHCHAVSYAPPFPIICIAMNCIAMRCIVVSDIHITLHYITLHYTPHSALHHNTTTHHTTNPSALHNMKSFIHIYIKYLHNAQYTCTGSSFYLLSFN